MNPKKIEPYLRSQACSLIAGTDEVGRGCLAGPVVAAAVILPHPPGFDGITDSKLLSPQKRDDLYQKILEVALAWGVGVVSPQIIDEINIFQASLKAMAIAVEQLSLKPEILLIDGRHCLPLCLPQKAIIQGDLHCVSIGAASIIAKVTRDRMMKEYEKEFPAFSFGIHKGYPTARHREELAQKGPCEIHRRSFKLL
ncbi:MAG: ribonuclease HII [Deltaproteobacteria bacterium]|nr:ribonuclease HII [Deltaproteobacteria bacterium]